MRAHLTALVPLFLVAGPAAAQTDWSHAAPVTVRLSNFDFAPSTLHLHAGAPVVLRLVNTSSGGHNFSAPAFFAAARVDPRSAAQVRRGTVDVGSRRTVEIRLVPTAGHYRLRCTHLLHSTFGMNGEIVVD